MFVMFEVESLQILIEVCLYAPVNSMDVVIRPSVVGSSLMIYLCFYDLGHPVYPVGITVFRQLPASVGVVVEPTVTVIMLYLQQCADVCAAACLYIRPSCC